MGLTPKPVAFGVMAEAMLSLLSKYPGLDGREILYEELEESYGIAIFADAGEIVLSEKKSITDHVKQQCQYPFNVIYRTESTTESQKLNVQAFLDTLGKWLCKEPVKINRQEYQLRNYPKLAGGREIKRIARQNSFGAQPSESGAQDWVLPVRVEYTHEFDVDYVKKPDILP